MADTLKIFRGVLLTAVGLVVVYESILYRLIDLVLVIGILLTIFGIGSLIAIFISRVMGLNEYSGDDKVEYVKSEKPLKINHRDYSEDFRERLDYSSSPNTRRGENISKRTIKSSDNNFNENKKSFIDKSAKTLSSFFSRSDDSDVSINPKAVLKKNPKAYDEYMEEPLENDFDSEIYEDDFFKKEYEEQTQISQVRQFKFTPNYEKPMKVTRKPKKRSVDDISLADFERVPKRTNEISNALADGDKSVRVMPTYESVNDVIVPIHNQSTASYSEDKSSVNDYDDSVELLNNVDNKREVYEDLNNDFLVDDNSLNNKKVFDADLAEDPIVIVHDEGSNLNSSVSSNLTGDYGLAIEYENSSLVEDYGLDLEDNVDLSDDREVQSNLSSLVDYKYEPKDLADLAEGNSKTIQVDPNNPDSVPIPKLLKSYVVCSKGILTSQEAFEEVAKHAKNNIFLEAPSIKDMGDVFLSQISKLNSRVIIQEFDIEDMSYVLLLSSLIKQGIKIKTLPSVNSFNLIGDHHALIISNSVDDEELEYGAVYTDESSISEIKELFEVSWELANDIDNILSK